MQCCFFLASHLFTPRVFLFSVSLLFVKSTYNSCVRVLCYNYSSHVATLPQLKWQHFEMFYTKLVTVHIAMHIIICNTPTTDISHPIHLSSGPVARFSLKIHVPILCCCVKISCTNHLLPCIVHVMRINNQPKVLVYRSFF